MFKVGHLQIAVVDEPLVVLSHATTYAVVGHRDEWRSGGVGSGGVEESPQNWAVFAVVLNLPDAGRGFDKGLVAVVVKLRSEFISHKGHRGHKVGDCDVLVEVVRRVDGICAALGGGFAVADVVKVVGVAVVRIDCGKGIS